MVDDETPKNCGGGGGHVLALCRALSSSGALSSTNRRPSTERHRIEIEKAPMDDLKHGIDGMFVLEPGDLIFLKVPAPACDVLSLSEGKKLSAIAPEHCLEVG